jgi:hypothetical protein
MANPEATLSLLSEVLQRFCLVIVPLPCLVWFSLFRRPPLHPVLSFSFVQDSPALKALGLQKLDDMCQHHWATIAGALPLMYVPLTSGLPRNVELGLKRAGQRSGNHH